METVLMWIGAVVGALFVVAVAVAWVEHLDRVAQPFVRSEPARPPRVRVDVPLDAPDPATAAPPPPDAGDIASRRAALDGALDRMAQPGHDRPRPGWIDTRPIVQPGPAIEPKRTPPLAQPKAGAPAGPTS